MQPGQDFYGGVWKWWMGWWIEKRMMVGSSHAFMNMQQVPLYLLVMQRQLFFVLWSHFINTTPLLLCCPSFSLYSKVCLFWTTHTGKYTLVLWKLLSIKSVSGIIKQGQLPASAPCLKWFNDAAFVQQSCRDQRKTIAQSFAEETGAPQDA